MCNICGKDKSVDNFPIRMPDGKIVEFKPCIKCLKVSENYCYTVCVNCEKMSWTDKKFLEETQGLIFGKRFKVFIVNDCIACGFEIKTKFLI